VSGGGEERYIVLERTAAEHSMQPLVAGDGKTVAASGTTTSGKMDR
jgi:hypothetical protein